MFPVIKFRQEYDDLVITAEVPVIDFDDCDLLLVVRYDDERHVITSPVEITGESFPLVCRAIDHAYRSERGDFWIMKALGELSLQMKA